MTNRYQSLFKTIVLTSLALVAFAANSVLCRRALGTDVIDAASFTSIRLLSGILMLFILVQLQARNEKATSTSWLAGWWLFLYAVTFSFAYLALDTGTGALILFGAVQITMIAVSITKGDQLHLTEWLGVLTAFGGLVVLNLPGATAPSFLGFTLMAIAGVAWGLYTLAGRGSSTPLLDTSGNFMRALPFTILLALFAYTTLELNLSTEGVLLAATSGAITSAIGYAIWYAALKDLSSTQAAVLQLSVPVLAAIGGILFMSESITFRLTVSAVMILGGILMVLLGKTAVQKAKAWR